MEKKDRIKVTLPDGTAKEFTAGVTALDAAKSIGERLAQAAVVAEIDGVLVDLSTQVISDCEFKVHTFSSPEGKSVFWHSAAHLLAQAVKRLYPKAKLTIGPAIENGFYYDIAHEPFRPEDLMKIEEEMKKIVAANYNVERLGLATEEAKKMFKDNKYKLEIIGEEAKGKKITAYMQGEFTDLCRGPHAPNTGMLKAFKLTKISAAYWRGDQKNDELQRIYGVAYPEKKMLDDYLSQLELAEKNDHKKLGQELDLFTFSDLVGSGLPLFTPRGTIIREEIHNFVQSLQIPKGFKRVHIPHITKKELYQISGHWQKFENDLFKIKSREGHEFAMKPMNCPHHTQLYAYRKRSYKELPIRFSEVTMCYRDEQTGELSGLARVRAFTQDDAHVFCRMTQVDDEAMRMWDIIDSFYSAFNMPLTVRFSRHDPAQMKKYLGTPRIWKNAEEKLLSIIKKRKVSYIDGPGEAAMYGPKIDFIAKDAIGRDWQLATIQLDFNLPERFNLVCTNENSNQERIVMIHRAISGSIERFMALLIEHYGGKFPLWLSPEQVRILTVADRFNDYARKVAEKYRNSGIRVEVDERSESIPYKVRDAELSKVNYILVAGEKEVSAGTVTVRTRENEILGTVKAGDFLKKLLDEINAKK